MSKQEKKYEEDGGAQERVRNDWRAIMKGLSYKVIVNNVPFMAFVAFLGVLYIGRNKQAVSTQRLLNAKYDTLKELRWEYVDVKSQMMQSQMEVEVMKSAGEKGMVPMTVPAFVIKKDTSIKQIPKS